MLLLSPLLIIILPQRQNRTNSMAPDATHLGNNSVTVDGTARLFRVASRFLSDGSAYQRPLHIITMGVFCSINGTINPLEEADKARFF